MEIIIIITIIVTRLIVIIVFSSKAWLHWPRWCAFRPFRGRATRSVAPRVCKAVAHMGSSKGFTYMYISVWGVGLCGVMRLQKQ